MSWWSVLGNVFFYFLDLVCLRALNWDVPHSQTPSPNGRFDPPKNTPCLCFLSGTLSKVKPLGQDWLIAAGAYSGFSSMKRLRVFQLPLGGTLVHRMSLPRQLLSFTNNLPVPIYTPGCSEALWELRVLPQNTTQCPRPGLLDPVTSALPRRPQRLHVSLHRMRRSVIFFLSLFNNL